MKIHVENNFITPKRDYSHHKNVFIKSVHLLILMICISGMVCKAQKSYTEKSRIPMIQEPILFNSQTADDIIKALRIFPANSPYNEDISKRPVASNSAAIIEGMTTRSTLGYNLDMGYVIVPPNQKKVDVEIYMYPRESDPGPYPIPDIAPIEDWSFSYVDKSSGETDPFKTLDKIQREGKGDRHVLVLDPYAEKLYEFYASYKTDSGWRAGQASIFDLTSNKMRPDGWTSTDAAGLSVFAATVRYPDVEDGIVSHVIRVTARRTRNAYVYPATHKASRFDDVNLPRMGERFRLKESTDISSFSPHAQAIARGMMKYGLIVADNGLDWLISITPDERFKGLDDLRKLKPGDFEVIVPSGPLDYNR